MGLRSNAMTKERFMGYVEIQENGCWKWTGGSLGRGYGQCWFEGKPQPAHRVSYKLFVGAIPEDRPLIDHQCHKPEECVGGNTCPHRGCVNPDHLEPSTEEQNTSIERGHSLIGRNRLVTHCPQGHEYDERNTKIEDGKRKCRKCRNRHKAEKEKRKRQEVRESRIAAQQESVYN